jgi:hypothetical protein
VIRATQRLDSFERRYAIEQAKTRSFREALAVYAALWKEAASLSPGFPGTWQDDIDADLELGRVLNGLPERA